MALSQELFLSWKLGTDEAKQAVDRVSHAFSGEGPFIDHDTLPPRKVSGPTKSCMEAVVREER